MQNNPKHSFESPLRDRGVQHLWIIATLLLAALAVGGRLAWQALNRTEPIVIAFANSMTGSLAVVGEEARVATQLYLDEVNAAGGIDGHLLKLQIFDDQSKPSVANANVSSILASRAVAVMGHSESATSLAGGVGYKNGHIAAIASNASGDSVTKDNPYYFRALSPNSAQSDFLAKYIHNVIMRYGTLFMRSPDIDLVSSPGPFGSSFREGFRTSDIGVDPKVFMIMPGGQLETSAMDVAEQLAKEPEPRIIVLGLATDEATPLLKAIRRHGIHSMIILASSAATDGFIEQFSQEPEERDEPGFFTDNVFAIAPMILDNTGALGQVLANRYQAKIGKRVGWFGACAQDAARVLVEAIRRAHIGYSKETLQDDRKNIRNALAGIDSPVHSVSGINGLLYFNQQREMPRPMQYGYFREGRFMSAPLQLVRVKDRDLVDIGHEIELKHMVQIGEQFFWLQRVVYTGIDIINLHQVDVGEGTFNAEFYLWMRYGNGDDVPSQIEFPGFSGIFDPSHPLKSSIEDGLDYRLWRVSGDFKAAFDLHDYPFDSQALLIRFRNRDFPREQITYVIDTFGLQLDQNGQSAGSADAFSDLGLWHVEAVRPFVDAFSVRSTLGLPALFNTMNRTDYGGFNTEIVIHRNAIAFMVKTLVPLFLLLLVVFATFFFPHTLAAERTTVPVTGILTSAVLLISITNQLPALGYTVALEYLFYMFFALCLLAMVTGILSESLRIDQRQHHIILVDQFGRIAYVAILIVTITIFFWKYVPQ